MGETRYTEKEMVMAKRDAARAMVSELRARNLMLPLGPEWPGSMVIAAELFPLPKVERPRVVTDADGSARRWRFVGGEFETALWNEPWENANHADIPLCASRVKMWADLLSRPSELVDDEG